MQKFITAVFFLWALYKMSRLLFKFFRFLTRRFRAWAYEEAYVRMLAREIRRDGGIK